ncbi:5-formyltetrahydrofolate cyclo-ligase-like [Dendronephthya gigantea]|uniref:5-formyltetrahydrofolate cyclo-ligase-like n=1 Tax=Dendronephthya gigantea TaxID=151771 RepID=UPI00106978F6|nr:5-formyltetrahydrofolate cyclo-ligase-like [Dendronephthya gigantea]
MAVSAGIKEAKIVLRKELKRRLAAMSEVEKQTESAKVAAKLFAMKEFQESKRVSLYMSMPNEVDTFGIMGKLFELKKKCFIPHYIGPVMKMVELSSMADYESLPLTSWNIKQPADDDDRADALETGGLDLIVVPGLGFTSEGGRLGRGKGYYDSYIKRCTELELKVPVTVALAYSVQICKSVPISDHDMIIDHVLCAD